MSSEFSPFSLTILNQKYAHTLRSGRQETWPEIAKRVATNVMGVVEADEGLVKDVEKAIRERKFMPGGRYLYASGRQFHQVQNCFEGKTRIVTRDGVKEIGAIVDTRVDVKTSTGEWVNSGIRSFGVQPLVKLTIIRNGKVKEIFTTEEHRWFLAVPNLSGLATQITFTTNELEPGDELWGVVGVDGTWKVVSVEPTDRVEEVFCAVVPDFHEFVLEDDVLTGNCLLLKADDSREGWADIMQKASMALMTGAGIGIVYSDVRPEGTPIRKTGGAATGPCALMKMVNEAGRYIMQGGSRRSAIWAGLLWSHKDIIQFITMKNWSPEVRALKEKDYNFPATMDGTNISVILDSAFFKAYNNPAHRDHTMAHNVYWTTVRQMLKTAEPGFSVDCGVNEGENLRNAPVCSETRVLTSEGYQQVSELVDRPVTVWTGMNWAPDVVFKKTSDTGKIVKVHFTVVKTDETGETKTEERSIRCDQNHPFMVMDGERVLRWCAGSLEPDMKLWAQQPDGSKLSAYVEMVHFDGVEPVYCADVKLPEHSFMAEGVIISNCTEVTSSDDSDICNLGSINMARVESLEEMRHLVKISTAFLLAGTVYSDVPYAKVDEIRRKNRRLGLGLMGLHEWLLVHGKKYGPDAELEEYLKIYATSTEVAGEQADVWNLSRPVKTRAIAPTGTIGIVAETTTGIEPIFCVAYKRRYLKGSVVNYQYVVDQTAKRLIDNNVSPDQIEDAYSLAEDVERRVAFQAWVQRYVDHSISSTINLPPWGSELNNDDRVQDFGTMLMKYLPDLRGMTCYPDGARGGQPLTAVKYKTAINHIGEVFEEYGDVCDITKGGTCGS